MTVLLYYNTTTQPRSSALLLYRSVPWRTRYHHGRSDRLSHHLNVGETKRIAIATMLSMNPQILVLDEPSAGLNPHARRTLINLLRELPITMLVSTHDMKLVEELFPRTIVMDEGMIVADGKTKDILADAKLLEAHGLEKP